MKYINIIGIVFFFSFVSPAQNSTFYGYFEAEKAQLIPIKDQETKFKEGRIVPNFKGRELIDLEFIPQHYPDRKWQQHQISNKSTSASVIWQTQGIGASISPPDPTGKCRWCHKDIR